MQPSPPQSNTQLLAPLIHFRCHARVLSFHTFASSCYMHRYFYNFTVKSYLAEERKNMTMAMKKMGARNGLFFPLLFCFILFGSEFRVYAAAASTAEECSDDFQKVMICLDYAKGKSMTPSNECCTAVKGIKDSDPKCLCFIIQQANSGSSDMLKSLGVQKTKLLQLPSACQLQNASVTNCPKLLGLSPSSPDAAIFSNVSSLATPASPATGTSASPSMGTKRGPYLVGPTVLIAMAIFFYAVPTGYAYMF